MTRMTLAKISHIHFPATKKAYERLIKMGEEKKNILVGAPQLDDINYKELIKKDNFYIQNNKVKINEGYLVILQHPVFKDQKSMKKF